MKVLFYYAAYLSMVPSDQSEKDRFEYLDKMSRSCVAELDLLRDTYGEFVFDSETEYGKRYKELNQNIFELQQELFSLRKTTLRRDGIDESINALRTGKDVAYDGNIKFKDGLVYMSSSIPVASDFKESDFYSSYEDYKTMIGNRVKEFNEKYSISVGYESLIKNGSMYQQVIMPHEIFKIAKRPRSIRNEREIRLMEYIDVFFEQTENIVDAFFDYTVPVGGLRNQEVMAKISPLKFNIPIQGIAKKKKPIPRTFYI